jgi:AcrR family transcriptional regulator
MLNMSSVDGAVVDDRSTKAKIRDAAIESFAVEGSATTVRKVAEIAGVSPALVIHHFGSMDRLRAACDEHVIRVIREQKTEAFGGSLDITAAIRDYGDRHLPAYLARMLTEDSEASAQLVDSITADAEVYMSQGVAAGTVKPSSDPEGRARVLVLFSLGSLVLHHHAKRLLGVDLVDPETTPSQLMAYAGPALEILGSGLFTDQFAEMARAAFEAAADETETT